MMKSHSKRTRTTQKPVTQKDQGQSKKSTLRHRQRLREVTIVLSLCVTIALFVVWSRLAVLEKGYRIHSLATQYERLEEEYRTLKLELATRKSPRHLAPLAQKKMGLRQPQANQVVVIPQSIRIAEVDMTTNDPGKTGLSPDQSETKKEQDQ